MAKIGMSKPKYSKITTRRDENGNEIETYSAPKRLAKGISMTTSINTAKASLYADNGKAESVNEFISGAITLIVDEIEAAVMAEITGATVDEGTGVIRYRDTDEPAYIRLGVLVRRINSDDPNPYSSAILTKVMFDPPADDYETKGESIVFKTVTLTGEFIRNVYHEWRIIAPWVGTEAEAEEAMDELLAPANE